MSRRTKEYQAFTSLVERLLAVPKSACKTFKFCQECCWCMAHRDEDSDDDPHHGWERFEARFTLGRQNAERKR